MLDGAADGTPPLRDRAEYRDWVSTCSREYLRLKHDAEAGRKSFLNAYGASKRSRILRRCHGTILRPTPPDEGTSPPISIVSLKNTTARIRPNVWAETPALPESNADGDSPGTGVKSVVTGVTPLSSESDFIAPEARRCPVGWIRTRRPPPPLTARRHASRRGVAARGSNRRRARRAPA